jgi:hypothetical protein
MAIKDGAAANARIGSVRSCAWGKSWRRQRDRDVETVVRGATETPVARRGRFLESLMPVRGKPGIADHVRDDEWYRYGVTRKVGT